MKDNWEVQNRRLYLKKKFIGPTWIWTNCLACRANKNTTTPQPIRMSHLIEVSWTNIAVDFLGPFPSRESLLVVIDLSSRFPFTEVMKSKTSEKLINRLVQLFSIFGYPKECMIMVHVSLERNLKIISKQFA